MLAATVAAKEYLGKVTRGEIELDLAAAREAHEEREAEAG